MSASFRIIAKIDIKNTSVIKGINFEGMRKVGDAKKFALNYFQKRIDELVINDVNASLFSRNTHTNFLKSSCEKIFIPVTLQGGFRTIDNIRDALRSGADKVSINTGAVYDKKLVANASKIFGNQAIVVSVDSKRVAKNKWEVFVDKGRERTGLNVVEWIKFIQKSGTGEIHLNSIDKDGTEEGFDISLINKVNKICKVPLVIGGGMGSLKHLDPIIKLKNIDGLCISSAFHYRKLKISNVKNYLKDYKNIRI